MKVRRSRQKKFEIRVRNNGQVNMHHVWAKTQEQAKNKYSGGGQIVSIRKVDPTNIFWSIELIKLDKQKPLGLYIGDGKFDSDINLDDALGLRKHSKNGGK